MKLSIVIVVLGLAFPLVAQAEEFAPYAGEVVAISDADLPLKIAEYKDSPFYTEEYSFAFHPVNKPPYTIRIGVSNMGHGRGAAFVHGSIIKGKKGKRIRYRIKESASAGTWKQGTEPFFIEVGRHRLRGGVQGFNLHLETDEMTADLEIKPMVPAWRPGTGRVDLARGEGLEVIVWPRAEVLGVIKARGEKTKVLTAVKGYAVVTRILSTASPALQPRRWVNFKSVKKDHTVLAQAFLPPAVKGDKLHGWSLVATDEEILLATHALEFKLGDFREDHGTKIPWIFTWAGEGVRGAVQALKLRSVVDELEKLPALERAVVSRFIQPMTWFLRGKYEVEAKGKKLSGPGSLVVNKIK